VVTHPLLGLLLGAAGGRPPDPDGAVEVLPPLPGPVDAVLAFTAHHLVVADVDPALVGSRLPPDDLGAPLGAPFLAWLGRRLGSRPGSLDVVLAAGGLGAPAGARVGADPAVPAPLELVPLPDPAGHPRVARAARYRTGLEVWADRTGAGVLALGRGLAGRRELAFEVAPAARGRGLGRRLAAAARHHTPAGEPLFAQVAPGNVASLRVLLAAGFQPLGAEVLFHRADPVTGNRRAGGGGS
jgi:GNAT superfamily N-acetyltransferase